MKENLLLLKNLSEVKKTRFDSCAKNIYFVILDDVVDEKIP